MPLDSKNIPVRKTSSGDQIETRPLYVEEWLDTLPYIDFDKTSRLLSKVTRATNKESIKPSVRLELVQLYNRPYQYYLDSQIRTGTQHTLRSIETMQKQIQVLQEISVNLAFACKLSVEESLKNKTLWRQSKPPLPAMLMSMNYLCHALIFSFLEYSPIPKNVWRELNFIYSFAEDLGLENSTISPLTKESKDPATSIASAYKRIILASLVDPHHLPFGAIWEIYNQLRNWNEYARIKPFQSIKTSTGYFVINIEADSRPVAYAKFDVKKTGDNNYRLIDAGNLGNMVQKHLDLLEMGQKLDDSVHLSEYYAKTILGQMAKSWGHPPTRYFPRELRDGKLKLAFGLNAIYFYANNEQEFVITESTNDEDAIYDSNGYEHQADITSTPSYNTEIWNLIDQGPGGFKVISNKKPINTIRVGDLVGLDHCNDPANIDSNWALGVVRWLMVRQGKIHKIGIQTIAAELTPVAIRAMRGSKIDNQFRRAFVAGDVNTSGTNSIITSKGFFIEEREIEINYAGNTFHANTALMVESALNFDHFNVIAN